MDLGAIRYVDLMGLLTNSISDAFSSDFVKFTVDPYKCYFSFISELMRKKGK